MSILLGIGDFSRIIAGSVSVLYAVGIGAASWGDYFGSLMLPTLLGNVIGGVLLVVAINHARVVSGEGRVQDEQDEQD